MFDLKKLSTTSIEAALQKAERYRLLNEPEDAESICRDVLAVDSDNRLALINLALALSDQFGEGFAGRHQESQQAIARLTSDYEREYYSGIMCERRAKAIHHRATPGWGSAAWEWLRRAMDCYERAEAIRPEDNDDAILRWNTCARMIMENSAIEPEQHESSPVELE